MQHKDFELITQIQEQTRELRATATFMIEKATNIEKILARLYESDNRLNNPIIIGPILSDQESAKLGANTLKKLSKAMKG